MREEKSAWALRKLYCVAWIKSDPSDHSKGAAELISRTRTRAQSLTFTFDYLTWGEHLVALLNVKQKHIFTLHYEHTFIQP